MLSFGSTLRGYNVEATDGKIGTAVDFLFDDRTWLVRWLVVDLGDWLPGRKVLLHPVAIGETDHGRQTLCVKLTKAQVQASPEKSAYEPVSAQMERHLYEYYGWETSSIENAFGANPISSRFSAPPLFMSSSETASLSEAPHDGDPNLRSVKAIAGYHIQASDGAIGQIEDLLIDETVWRIRYLVIDTGNWLPGKKVLISPYAVREISWADRQIRLDVKCDQVRSSPSWSSLGEIDATYEKDLHDHYDWPGHT